jgi:hypothetical protein
VEGNPELEWGETDDLMTDKVVPDINFMERADVVVVQGLKTRAAQVLLQRLRADRNKKIIKFSATGLGRRTSMMLASFWEKNKHSQMRTNLFECAELNLGEEAAKGKKLLAALGQRSRNARIKTLGKRSRRIHC